MLDKKLLEKLENATKHKDLTVAKLNKDIQEFYDILNKIQLEDYDLLKYEFDHTSTEMKPNEVEAPKLLLNKLKKLNVKLEDGTFFKRTYKALYWTMQEWGVTQEWKGKRALSLEPAEFIEFIYNDSNNEKVVLHVKTLRHSSCILIPSSMHHYQIQKKQEARKHLNGFLEKIIKELNIEENNA